MSTLVDELVNNSTVERIEGTADDPALLNFGAHDVGNAEATLFLNSSNVVYSDAFGWMVRDVGRNCWVSENAEHIVNKCVKEAMRARMILAYKQEDPPQQLIKKLNLSHSNIKSAMAELKSLCAVPMSSFDTADHLLNCPNGIVDLMTGEIAEHTAQPIFNFAGGRFEHNEEVRLFTYCTATELDQTVNYKTWHDWVVAAVGSEETARYLQRVLGYALTGDTSEECLFYLYGKARAGKGTFTEAVGAVLGKPLADSTRFDVLTTNDNGQGFELAKLRASRIVFAGEGTKNALTPSTIKQLTGGDDISCAHKYGRPFSYRPKFKLIISSNHPANSDVDDDAVWTRLKVIEFVQSHLKNPDTNLKKRMKSPENLPLILKWAIEGAVNWYANGLAQPAAVTDTIQRHRDEHDYIARFIDDCCTVDDANGHETVKVLRHVYEMWCEEQGATVAGAKTFNKSMSKKGYPINKKRPTHGQEKGKSVRCYIGVRLISE